MNKNSWLHHIGLIARREMLRLAHQPVYFFCMIFASIVLMVFFLILMSDCLPTNLPIAVFDQVYSANSR